MADLKPEPVNIEDVSSDDAVQEKKESPITSAKTYIPDETDENVRLREQNAQLLSTVNRMEDNIKELQKKGIRDNVVITGEDVQKEKDWISETYGSEEYFIPPTENYPDGSKVGPFTFNGIQYSGFKAGNKYIVPIPIKEMIMNSVGDRSYQYKDKMEKATIGKPEVSSV